MYMNRWTLAVVIFAGLACVGLVVFVNMPRPGVTKANFDRIQHNMTRREVEKLLGGPHYDVSGGTKTGPASRVHFWKGCAGQVWVTFDAKGDEAKIISKHWHSERWLSRMQLFLDSL